MSGVALAPVRCVTILVIIGAGNTVRTGVVVTSSARSARWTGISVVAPTIVDVYTVSLILARIQYTCSARSIAGCTVICGVASTVRERITRPKTRREQTRRATFIARVIWTC